MRANITKELKILGRLLWSETKGRTDDLLDFLGRLSRRFVYCDSCCGAKTQNGLKRSYKYSAEESFWL